MSIWSNHNFGPMLLSEIDKPFNSNNYLFEIKFDGIRALMFISKDKFKIQSRNKIDLTNLFPELKSIQDLITKDTILDGEIVVMDKNKSSFSKLGERTHLKNKNKILLKSKENPVVFVVFDILYQNKDLTNIPLIKRKEILDKINENDYLIKSKYYLNDGIKLFQNIKKLGLEGIVAKEKNSLYEINKRSHSWIKIKNLREEVFIVGGYELKKNNYISLILGELRNNKLYYVGNVSLTTNKRLYSETINAKKINKSPFIDYNKEDVYYIKPSIKCNVKYLERTFSNHLRQPIIKDN